MPRDTAQSRVKAGKLDATTVTVDRPETQVRGLNGDLFTLYVWSAARVLLLCLLLLLSPQLCIASTCSNQEEMII